MLIKTHRRTLKCTRPECNRGNVAQRCWAGCHVHHHTERQLSAPAVSSCFMMTEAAEKSNYTLQIFNKTNSMNVQNPSPDADIPRVLQYGFSSVSFFPSMHLCLHPLCLRFHLNGCHCRHRPGEHFASPSTATNRAASGAPLNLSELSRELMDSWALDLLIWNVGGR